MLLEEAGVSVEAVAAGVVAVLFVCFAATMCALALFAWRSPVFFLAFAGSGVTEAVLSD